MSQPQPPSSDQSADNSPASHSCNHGEGPIQQWFERTLWASRWMLVLGVLANIIGAVLMVLVAAYDFVHLIQVFFQIVTGETTLAASRAEVTFVLIEIVDGFLMAGVLFIFGFGLYELFISKISVDHDTDIQGKILNIESIDHLKAKLGNLILMILVVKFFYFSIELKITTVQEITYFAASVCMIGLALYLSHAKKK